MNELLPSLFYLLAGLAALVGGGELLVRGAARLAAAARVSPLVIGLTVVAFGTSTPELAVSLKAARDGTADIALGNVVGSNIFNVLFILGVAAMIVPLTVASQLIRRDVPIMVACSGGVLILGLDGTVGRGEGLVLFLLLLAYTARLIVESRREQTAVVSEFEYEYGRPSTPPRTQLLIQVAWIVGGLALLALGGNWLVDGAVDIARCLRVSELLIGTTIVAAGTSLPEVATSLLASIRGERDIAVGNVVGSNIFNILGVLGVSAFAAPAGIAVSPAAIAFDIPVMIAVAAACLPIFFSGYCIARWEGALFLAYYVAYTAYLVLSLTNASAGQLFGMALLLFVLPLTVITVSVTVARSIHNR